MDKIDFKALKPQIQEICIDLDVRKMEYFGSVNTPDFTEESDIDILVEFGSNSENDLFMRYFDLKERLETLFQHPVDVVTNRKFKNPFFEQTVKQTRHLVYG